VAETDGEAISHSTRTIEGDVFGTPAYMPPEQAAGNMEDVDERSDIFALGGILYKILTHEAPYAGATVAEVLRKAVRAYYKAPRVKSPWNRIPRELESICLKAMKPKHGDRYESAEALIRDVQAHMDHRAVAAHPYGPWSRFVRFVQRHPVGSVAGGITLVLLSLGSAATGLLWARSQANATRAELNASRAREQQAVAEAERLRAQKAEVRATSAQETLDKGRLVAGVIRGATTELGPVIRDLKRSFHSGLTVEEKQALGDRLWPRIEAFEKTVAPDGASQATWLAVKGWLKLYAGYQAEAVALFGESRKTDPDVAYGNLFEGMLWFLFYINKHTLPSVSMSSSGVTFAKDADEPALLKHAREQCDSMLTKARASKVWGEGAAEDFEEILDAFQAVHLNDPEKAEAGLTRALSVPEMAWIRDEILLARGKALYRLCKFDEGLADVAEFLKAAPHAIEAYETKGLLWSGKAVTEAAAGRHPRVALKNAVASLTVRIDRGAVEARIFNVRGSTRALLGEVESSRGGDAKRIFEEALEDFSRALSMDPGYVEVLNNRSRTYTLLGEMQILTAEDPEGSFRKALEDAGKVLDKDPGYSLARTNRANAAQRLASILASRGGDFEALFALAEEDYEQLLKENPDDMQALLNRAVVCTTRGMSVMKLGRDPREDLQRAIADYSRVIERNPDERAVWGNRASTFLSLARAQRQMKLDPSSAVNRSISDFDEAMKRRPNSFLVRAQAGMAHEFLGDLKHSAGLDPRQTYRRAVQLYDDALRLNPRNAEPQGLKGNTLRILGDLESIRGAKTTPLYVSAVEALDEFVKVYPDRAEFLLYRAMALENLGRFDEALKGFERAHQLAGNRYAMIGRRLQRARSFSSNTAWNITRLKALAALRRWDVKEAKKLFARSIDEAKIAAADKHEKLAPLVADSHAQIAMIEVLASAGRECPLDEGRTLADAERDALLASAEIHLKGASKLGLADIETVLKSKAPSPLNVLPEMASLLEIWKKVRAK
jgi:serine/threonine-protein kinase